MIQRLSNENGMTLLEVMATVAIMAFALVSIYMGILYAEKQMQRNYHDRVAELTASGEIEWQKFYKDTYKTFDTFVGRSVVIDNLARGRTLNGSLSVRRLDTYENIYSISVPYTILEATVAWQEPGDKTTRSVVVREDIY